MERTTVLAEVLLQWLSLSCKCFEGTCYELAAIYMNRFVLLTIVIIGCTILCQNWFQICLMNSNLILADINECLEGTDNCDANAVCQNNDGSFACACRNGYTGDGRFCFGKRNVLLSFT